MYVSVRACTCVCEADIDVCLCVCNLIYMQLQGGVSARVGADSSQWETSGANECHAHLQQEGSSKRSQL